MLAGCAAPPVKVADPDDAPRLYDGPLLDPLRMGLPLQLEPGTVTGPFSALAAAELEALPVPADDLWTRIIKGYAIPDVNHPFVAKWEQWYSSRPDYVARMIDRSRRYLYHIVLEVERRRMPLEIALLPMVESAYNPVALSSARAAGIWQFMPSTGKHFGLQQNFWFDSRRDVLAATDGALNYLQKLHDQFNDWQLALAGYNWGEGNVARAVAKNQRAGLPTDYASIDMPDETRNYLPKLQAVKNIVADPGKYGLELADIPDAPYFAVVRTTKQMDLKRAAELAEMPLDEFQSLNPHHNRPVIAGADEHAILLPIDRAELFAAKLDLLDQPLVSWQAYRLHRGETLPQVAAKFALPVETLRAVNGIGPRSRVPEGHTLLVPAQRPSAQSEATLSQAVFTTVPQGRTFYYRVKRGETMAGIASRYGVTTQDIRGWNGLTQTTVKAGQSLRIVSDNAPNAARSVRPSGKPVLATKAKPTRTTTKPKPAAVPPSGKPPRAGKAPAPRSGRQ